MYSRPMRELPLSEINDALATAVDELNQGGDRVLLTRKGAPVAAVVSAADLALLERLEDEHDAAEVDERLVEVEREGTRAHDELLASLEGDQPARVQ